MIDRIKEIIGIRAYEGLQFGVPQQKDKLYLKFDEIPGLKEAGWNEKAYEIAK